MNILNFALMLSSLIFSSAYCVTSNNMDDKQFMTMSDTCWVSPSKTYGCDYIPVLLTVDPNSMTDIKTVCNTSSKSGYTNTDFANLINMRLSSLGLPSCHVTVMKGYENHQLRDQCPSAFHQYCKTLDF